MTSRNVFPSVFHSFPSHSVSKYIFFASHPSLEYVVINYLFRLPYLGILKSAILLLLLSFVMLLSCKKRFTMFSEKTYFKFWPVILTTNKALVIILWYSEWINGYDKNLANLKLLSLALKKSNLSHSLFLNIESIIRSI